MVACPKGAQDLTLRTSMWHFRVHLGTRGVWMEECVCVCVCVSDFDEGREDTPTNAPMNVSRSRSTTFTRLVSDGRAPATACGSTIGMMPSVTSTRMTGDRATVEKIDSDWMRCWNRCNHADYSQFRKLWFSVSRYFQTTDFCEQFHLLSAISILHFSS